MRGWICALIVGAWVEAAVAQQSAGDVYVTAGASVPHQRALEAPSAPPFAAPAGTTVGWLAGGGIFVSPTLSVEAEVSPTGTMHASQSGRHATSEVSTRRDWIVSLGLKKHLWQAATVGLEPIAGVVLLGDEGTYVAGLGASSSRGYYPLVWVPGVMFGADIRIGRDRVAFIAGLRFAYTAVPTGSDCVMTFSGRPECFGDGQRWQYHHPQWTQRPSAALRVSF